jgi:hypothetical protein
MIKKAKIIRVRVPLSWQSSPLLYRYMYIHMYVRPAQLLLSSHSPVLIREDTLWRRWGGSREPMTGEGEGGRGQRGQRKGEGVRGRRGGGKGGGRFLTSWRFWSLLTYIHTRRSGFLGVCNEEWAAPCSRLKKWVRSGAQLTELGAVLYAQLT